MTTMLPARWTPLAMTRGIVRELLPFAVGIAAWQILSSLNIWPPVLFPSPMQVFQAFFADLGSGVLLTNMAVSLKSLGIGFLVGAVIAVPLGYLMGLNRASRDFFDPLVNLLQAIPGLAWIPFAILWFGLGQGAVTFIIVMSVFFPVLHNLLTGIRTVQPVLIEAVRTSRRTTHGRDRACDLSGDAAKLDDGHSARYRLRLPLAGRRRDDRQHRRYRLRDL